MRWESWIGYYNSVSKVWRCERRGGLPKCQSARNKSVLSNPWHWYCHSKYVTKTGVLPQLFRNFPWNGTRIIYQKCPVAVCCQEGRTCSRGMVAGAGHRKYHQVPTVTRRGFHTMWRPEGKPPGDRLGGSRNLWPVVASRTDHLGTQLEEEALRGLAKGPMQLAQNSTTTMEG